MTRCGEAEGGQEFEGVEAVLQRGGDVSEGVRPGPRRGMTGNEGDGEQVVRVAQTWRPRHRQRRTDL